MQSTPENFQYDSCVSRGICSVNPRTSALTVILVIFLKLTAKFLLIVNKSEPIDKKIKDLFLETIIIAVSQQEFCETYFFSLSKSSKNCFRIFAKKAMN